MGERQTVVIIETVRSTFTSAVKTHNLLQVVNRCEQGCAAPSEQCCQQGCAAIIPMLLQHYSKQHYLKQ